MADALLLGMTISVGSALTVLGALMVFAGVSRRRTPPVFSPDIEDQDAVFIFRDHVLVDCSDRGRRLLSAISDENAVDGESGAHAGDLDNLLAYLAPHFPDIHQQLAQLAEQGALQLDATDESGLSLTARWRSGLAQLRLADTNAEGALVAMDRLSYNALHEELRNLRDVTRAAPLLIWQSDEKGQILWANSAYIAALHDSGQTSQQPLTWPLPPLFAEQDMSGGRLGLTFNDMPRWYSYHSVTAGCMVLHFATPIDAAVQSEFARREMMQMLTRTFATLPVGLALFDADRRLQVFNPALVDLTGLDPFFLAARPDLGQMLYTLRELRMLPEPKDFSTWHDEIVKMEEAAASGSYSEDWHLETGRIYHVTATPQPNGALAFFVQDTTSEATLLRGYRAEIETAQHILDLMPDAVVAFNMAGQAVFANAGYVQLWGRDPCADIADSGIEHAIQDWATLCEKTSFWTRLVGFVADPDTDTELTGTGTLKSGTAIALRAQRLVGGGVVVTFRRLVQENILGHPGFSHHAERVRSVDQAALLPVAADTGRPAIAGSEDAPVKLRSVKHKGSRIRV
ncbi:PAS domain-containing protein [Roseinatronobacter alkalisoli]|uniref:PAS-domain containing protein n=1 Tax=Roseinatronobacter alkalisoli TaxID=3028235 RepID=A0ABT5T3X9_9RHOB|nr:PAS domain-containing protein [Roseinatronobacter sp. HJB301]MDD7969820.1 PAS-domain containing protein [Roseinatronobacter sp. HJB301]